MKRLNVNFYDEIYEHLEIRAKKNRSKSIAQQVRELVDLGLKVEAAAQKSGDGSADDSSEKLIKMLKQNLIWMLETRLLSRHLVEKLPNENNQINLDLLETYKEKANNYVEGLVNAAVK